MSLFNVDKTIQVGGKDVFIRYNRFGRKMPVMLLLHGGHRTYRDWVDYKLGGKEFSKLAVNNGFAIVAPDSGVSSVSNFKQWNWNSNSSDFDHLANVLSAAHGLSDKFDMNNIVVTGISSGGWMADAFSLKCRNGRVVASVLHSSGSKDKVIWPAGAQSPKFNLTEPDVSSTHPPTALVHGVKDDGVPVKMSDLYCDALEHKNIKTVLYTSPDGGHYWLNEFNADLISWCKDRVS